MVFSPGKARVPASPWERDARADFFNEGAASAPGERGEPSSGEAPWRGRCISLRLYGESPEEERRFLIPQEVWEEDRRAAARSPHVNQRTEGAVVLVLPRSVVMKA